MKKIILFVFTILISSSLVFAQAPVVKKGQTQDPKTEVKNNSAPVVKAQTTAPAKLAKGVKALSGEVVNLLSAVSSAKAPALTKDEAVGMAARGELLALKSAGKLYLVVFADGINASKKLAEKAGAKITVTGKVKAKGGISMIIVDSL